MISESVRYEVEDGVAHVVLDRPEVRNALTDAMFDEIVGCLRRAEIDDDVRAVLLRGEGPSFCAGFDMSQPDGFYGESDSGHRFAIAKLRRRAEVMREVLYSLKPTVARVHGHCIGAGMYLVLVASFAVAADDAVFGLPEERFGSAGTSWLYPFLASQCGIKKANEIVMTGRRIEASEAERLNIVSRVVPADALDEDIQDLLDALCSLPREGLAVSRAAAHMTYGMLGVDRAFPLHYAMHPMIVDMERQADEFDFHRAVQQEGLRDALRLRDERFGGRYWGW